MYNLQLSHWRRARIWIDDLPSDYVFEFLGHIETRFGSNTTSPSVGRVAIEILMPHGGKSDYGLLGGEFVPNECNELVVTAYHSGPDYGSLVDSLAAPLDVVRVGLPLEYSQAVVSGIGMVGSDAVLPAGQLRVFLATHGTFNSSIFFFRRLGKALFKIMTAPVLPLDEEEMARFLDEVLKSISSEG